MKSFVAMGGIRSTWIKFAFAFLLIVGLPVLIWAVATQRIELRKKASESQTVCWNRVISQSGTQTDVQSFSWPDACKGNASASSACAQILVPLTPEELTEYRTWVASGSATIPGCDTQKLVTCNLTTNPPTQCPTGSTCQSQGLDGASGVCLPNAPYTGPGCARMGCNGELCRAENDAQGGNSICTAMYQPQYACYRNARCEKQSDGVCGWTQTDELAFCFSPTRTPAPPRGCYYQQVECVRAPCNPILVCPTPSPSSCSPNGSACTISDCPVCSGTMCPRMPCRLTQGTCSGNVCIANPTPTPTPAGWCPGPNGTSCQTSWSYRRTDCTPGPNRICADFNQFITGTCQNNQCVFPTPSPPSGCYFTMACTDSYPPHCTRLLNCPTTPTSTPTPSPTPPPGCYVLQTYPPQIVCPTGIPTPTPIPTLYPQKLEIWVRLSGVTGGQANGAKLTSVKFYLKNGGIMAITTPLTLAFQSDTTSGGGTGVYSATVDITNPLPAGTQFRLSVKGEKHGAVKFCNPSLQTGPCGDNEYITMPATSGTYRVYLTGIPLPAGDLNQDGAINQTDVNLVTDVFKKPSSQITAADLKLADVNYDGYIDNFDLSLVLQSLATRYDE